MWHASVAIWSDGLRAGSMKPTGQWSRDDWRLAEKVLAKVLNGVGSTHEVREVLRYTLQIRRLVNDEELAIVGRAVDVRPKA